MCKPWLLDMKKGCFALIALALSLGYARAAIPFITTLPATAVATNRATLNGHVDPQGAFTTVWFEFGPTTAYGSATPQQAIGFAPMFFSDSLTGLSNGVTYHYRAVALNQGFFFGGDQSFTTGLSFSNVAWYRLGENDPGAANGGTVTTTTRDLIGTKHLKQYGGPLYTNAVSAEARNRIGSSLAVQFNGTSQYLSNALVSSAIDNFGIEAWVKPNNVNAGTRIIAFNGNTAANGWGLFQDGSTYYGLLGGVVTFGAITAVPGTWAHVALVRDNGTSTLYVNGAAWTTTTSVPNPPMGGFTLATGAQQPTGEFFNGAIDEVRVFRFQPGQFNVNQLLFNVQRVVTLAASGVTGANPTLNGSANPIGLPTSAWFEWGLTTNYGNVTPPQAIGDGTSNTFFGQVLNGLTSALYHFRAVASNTLGIVAGADQSFQPPLFSLVANLTPVYGSSAAWGDYDNDGLHDILLSGATRTNGVFEVWRNTGSGFAYSNLFPSVFALADGAVRWGDYNNDGRLDIVFGGTKVDGGSGSFRPEVWRNTGSGFVSPLIPFTDPYLQYGRVAWGDHDNDGLLDILLTGNVSLQPYRVTEVWRNAGSDQFANVHAGLPPVDFGSVAWGDYDNDGRLDILVTGFQPSVGWVSQVWRNTGSGFTNINAGLPGVERGSVAWGDYDNDGQLDILLTGATNSTISSSLIGMISQVWRNTGSGFTNINAGLPGLYYSSVAWGDYDNDGLLDILLTGATNPSTPIGMTCQVWRNTGSGFTNINAGLPGVLWGSAAWGDYNNDGRLDILLTGGSEFDSFGRVTQGVAQVWQNNASQTNTPPTAPSGLRAVLASNFMTFTWNASSDAQTPVNGLRYNLRIGTTPGGSDVLSPMSAANGWRRLPEMGARRLNARFKYTLGTPYYWSVQAVDTAFAGSPWASEQSFKLLQWDAPVFLTSVSLPMLPVGDYNANGVIDQSELNNVLSNFWPSSPWLQMTNLAGLGGSNVTFVLSNSTAGAFSVEYSTNLIDWYFLGPAIPRYLFDDTNAPLQPQRYYRLRWP